MILVKISLVQLLGIFVALLHAQAKVEAMSFADQVATYDSVGQFLRQWRQQDYWWRPRHLGRQLRVQNSTESSTTEPTDSDWLPNSNMVGFSYNPLMGDPVCYTGGCQMSGFGLPLFQMEFNTIPLGTCITKRIPKNVEAMCLPVVDYISTTEMISNLEQLKNSQSDAVSWGVGFEISLGAGPMSEVASFGFNYKESKQTNFMIDNMFKKNSDIFRTYVKVTTVKLSLFEPILNLSTAFRHVIENMPSEDSSITERYIKDYILNYFGIAYVSNIVLGGIAQLTAIVKKDGDNSNQQNSQSSMQGVGLTFGKLFNFNYQKDDNESNLKINEFSKTVDVSYSTTLGGTLFTVETQKLAEWFLTVPNNPAVVQFKIDPILDLLSNAPNRFPGDQNIATKKKLILRVLSDQFNRSKVYCEDDCTDSAHGTCTPTGYFQYGTCTCKSPFTGRNCAAVITPSPAPSAPALQPSTTAPPAPAPQPSTTAPPAPALQPVSSV